MRWFALVRKTLILMIVAAGLLAAACSSVFSKDPVGVDLPEKPLDSQFWNGYWEAADYMPVAVHVSDANNGRIDLASMKFDSSKSTFTMTIYAGALRQASTDMLFLSVGDPDHPESNRWEFAGLLGGHFTAEGKDEVLMMFWMPEVERFKEWIDAKKFPGSIENRDVILGKLTPAMVDQITSPSTGLIDWRQPMPLKKLRN